MKLRPASSAPRFLPALALLVLASLFFALPASAQPASAPQPSEQSATPQKQTDSAVTQEPAKQTGEAAGEDEEENAALKHAKPVRWLARAIGLSVHGTHLLLSVLNFSVIVIIFIWAGCKYLPGIFRDRNAAIQRSLEEARAASQDANRRLADIEGRLRQLDVEIGQMQATAEKESSAEQVRIRQAAEEDIRKVVQSAEQEIAAAAKQARRELSAHTAGLAVALARQQVNIDSSTDQVLVRTFATGLASPSEKDGGQAGGKDGN